MNWYNSGILITFIMSGLILAGKRRGGYNGDTGLGSLLLASLVWPAFLMVGFMVVMVGQRPRGTKATDMSIRTFGAANRVLDI